MKHGVYASFMPKPLAGAPGSGMHVHQSLFDLDGNNAFFDPDDSQGYTLSKVAKRYLAGLSKYAPEFCAITNQHVNSYKRLRRRRRGAHLPFVGPREPLHARARARLPTRVARARAASSCAAPTPALTPTLPSPSCWRRVWRASKRGSSRPAPIEDRDLFTPIAPGAAPAGVPHASRKPWRGR